MHPSEETVVSECSVTRQTLGASCPWGDFTLNVVAVWREHLNGSPDRFLTYIDDKDGNTVWGQRFAFKKADWTAVGTFNGSVLNAYLDLDGNRVRVTIQ